MHQSEIHVAGANGEIAVGLGLWYDSERLMLEGIYLDEVTAYRARKGWIEAFEVNFLLEDRNDFVVRVYSQQEIGRFCVKCEFASACGRYAFWRLTHHQATEVQFLLETAHLPVFSTLPEMPIFDSYRDTELPLRVTHTAHTPKWLSICGMLRTLSASLLARTKGTRGAVPR